MHNDLEKLIQEFDQCLIHTNYLLMECSREFPDRSSLRALHKDLSKNIDKLKSLLESKP